MEGKSGGILFWGLAVTHLIWAVSLFMDPAQYSGKPIVPAAFGMIHLIVGITLMTRYKLFGAVLSSLILGYYWAFVKPRAPVAEPQSVGILVLSVALSLPLIERALGRNVSFNLFPLLARLGLAYPFFEWGLDALRNPAHFVAYLAVENSFTAPILRTVNLGPLMLAFGLAEVVLAVILTIGTATRLMAIMSIGALVAFSVIAAYPLALPQDIVLGAAAFFLLRNGGGSYSLSGALRGAFSS